MLKRGEIRMIKKLKEEGMSIRAIARKLGHCPKTIRKYLALDGDRPPRIERVSTGSKVDPYLPYIAKVLQEVSNVTLKP